jgi:hypothetical protein
MSVIHDVTYNGKRISPQSRHIAKAGKQLFDEERKCNSTYSTGTKSGQMD